MKIIQPSFIIESCPEGESALLFLEKAARTCYKSEDKIAPGSAEKLIRHVIARGHESVLEHLSATVRFICDRRIETELVRHRLASFSVESTRFCRYDGDGVEGKELTFIRPCFWNEADPMFYGWGVAMSRAEEMYLSLLKMGAKPEEARSVLPSSHKSEVVMTANLREWRHILKLRTAKAAHPQMRQLMVPLLAEFQKRIPVVFDDIEVNP